MAGDRCAEGSMIVGALGDAISSWYAANNNLINTIGLNAILALSIYVMLACGQLSLASSGYMAIGAYTAALLTTNAHWPFWAQILAGMALAGAIALLLGLPLLRLRGVYLAISTVGFVAVVQIFFTNWGPGGGGGGTGFIPATTRTWQIYLALAALCFLFWRLEGSAIGRSFAAIRQDEEAARSLGIDPVAHKLGAFAVSGLIAGLAGVLYARLHFFVQPSDFNFDLAVNTLIYVIVGGSFTFLGSVIGALIITALPEVLRFLQSAPSGSRDIVQGAILLLVILFLPGGLVELPARLWRLVQPRRSRHPTMPADGGTTEPVLSIDAPGGDG
ncbi:MAG TPA: branched-chain amino acid ABC transporter permease [Chloroflexota bacterium]|nr:branched-chain amino acid ABC transporter permease [Chloroflexota bacterium]